MMVSLKDKHCCARSHCKRWSDTIVTTSLEDKTGHCKRLALSRLYQIKNCSDFIEIFKILNGVYDVNGENYFYWITVIAEGTR